MLESANNLKLSSCLLVLVRLLFVPSSAAPTAIIWSSSYRAPTNFRNVSDLDSLCMRQSGTSSARALVCSEGAQWGLILETADIFTGDVKNPVHVGFPFQNKGLEASIRDINGLEQDQGISIATGCNELGRFVREQHNCNQWKNAKLTTNAGISGVRDSTWLVGREVQCNSQMAFYCVDSPNEMPVTLWVHDIPIFLPSSVEVLDRMCHEQEWGSRAFIGQREINWQTALQDKNLVNYFGSNRLSVGIIKDGVIVPPISYANGSTVSGKYNVLTAMDSSGQYAEGVDCSRLSSNAGDVAVGIPDEAQSWLFAGVTDCQRELLFYCIQATSIGLGYGVVLTPPPSTPPPSPTSPPLTSAPTLPPTSPPLTTTPSTPPPAPSTPAPTQTPTTRAPVTQAPTPFPTTRAPIITPTSLLTTLAPTTRAPTLAPTSLPTTLAPTPFPTTQAPARLPTRLPTSLPTTAQPTLAPTTHAPTRPGDTFSPTSAPTTTRPTTSQPTSQPTTNQPTTTQSPTTLKPTLMHTFRPSFASTSSPASATPTVLPSSNSPPPPTKLPSRAPTLRPTTEPVVVVVTNFTGNVTQNVTVPGNGADVFVVLPSALFVQGSNSSASVVIIKAPLVDHPSSYSGEMLAGGGDSVVSIDVMVDGQAVSVMDLAIPVEFTIPRSQPVCEAQRNAATKCVWWDLRDMIWRTDNCSAMPVFLAEGVLATKCSCNHLTDFAVLLDQAQSCYAPQSTAGYLPFAVVYVLIVLYCVVNVVRLLLKKEPGTRFLRSQHALIGCVAFIRLISSLRFYGVLGSSLIFEAFVTALPYLLEFWIFTRLASTWIGLVSFTLLTSDLRWDKIKPFLYGINIVGSLFTVALFVAFLVQLDFTTALVGTIGIASIYMLLSVTFLYYSGRLVKTMASGTSRLKKMNSSMSSNSATAPSRCFTCLPASKILYGGRTAATCFAMQAVTSVLALVLEKQLIPYFTGLFLFFNCMALICLLLVYHGALTKALLPKAKLPILEGQASSRSIKSLGSSEMELPNHKKDETDDGSRNG